MAGPAPVQPAQTQEVVGTLSASLSWTRSETETTNITSNNNTIVDDGKVIITTNLTTGTSGLYTSNALFHDIRVLSSGGTDSFNLNSLAQPVFDTSFTQSFSSGVVRGLLVINVETGLGKTIGIRASGANAFNAPWGSFSGIIPIQPGGAEVKFHPGVGWAVSNTERTFDIIDTAGSGSTYHITIIGGSG